MGLFNRNSSNEKMYQYAGYIIGCHSRIIYHVPKSPFKGAYIFPEGTVGLSPTAIMEMRQEKAKYIIVPGSFKKFNVELVNFEYLSLVELQEGVEEVNCLFGKQKNATNVIFPKTIKKIGYHNYPIDKNLDLPEGVIEIEKMFASHDTNLVSVSIPGTIKIIPQGAFNQCKNLQTVILNEGVETSLLDAFRGTNNLHTLVLPSTYNGSIHLPMDARPLSTSRGTLQYDGKNFVEEQNSILNIKIKRGNKNFEFNIRRGEQPVIEIKQNKIEIRCQGQPQIISIDCTQLEPGIYDIQNGTLKLHQTQSMSQSSQEQDIIEKLDTIFQNAYRDNITKREDFKGLSSATKMQIKKAMKTFFIQIAKQFGTMNTDYETFDYLYNRALNEIKINETTQEPTEFGSSGMKR